MDNQLAAAILEEIGILLELKGENPFKTRAYSNAARALESLPAPLEQLVRENRLSEIPGLGDALQKKISELVTTGRLAYHEELRASLPAGLLDMLQIPGLGPKKVRAIHEALHIDSLDALEVACQQGHIAALKGFGGKTQAKILEGIAFRRAQSGRHLLIVALTIADAILDQLRGHPQVTRCSNAGSLRRWKEVIGDLDFVASSRNPSAVIDAFISQPGVAQVLSRGDTKASIRLEHGIQADLRVVPDADFAPALAYFTGSKAHNIRMRQRASDRGLRLNEYGLFRSTEETRDPALRLPCATEADLYHALDLEFIPPELREDHGEFEAAEQAGLPRLVEWTELRGSLHNHSDWSDGRQSLDEIAAMADELGCDYWAITDHSRSSFVANGLDTARLNAQLAAVAAVNDSYARDGSDFRLLTGSEVDILADGHLDFPDEILARLDVVVASIHQGFSGDEATITRRLIRAAENPHVHMLGHLTGRLLLEREAYKVNVHAVIDACAATGTWIELNANPHRFDLDWRHWRHARDRGVRCVINCDAHRETHASYLVLGAGIARKGWLERHHIINTLPLPALRTALAHKRAYL